MEINYDQEKRTIEFNKSGKAKIDFNLKEGQVVEFYENADNHKYGVVTGGFGLSQRTIGGAIFAYFGKTEEDAIQNFKYFDERYSLRGHRHPKNRLCRRGEIITRDEKEDRRKGRWEVTEQITFGEKSPMRPIEKGQHLIANEKDLHKIFYDGTRFTVEETGLEYTLPAAALAPFTKRTDK
jgi:hypothetical protein